MGDYSQDFSVRPCPLGPNSVLKVGLTVLGLGLGFLRTKGLGSGLDNIFTKTVLKQYFLEI